jgi:DNA-binding transcriptional LysR family regulator
MHGAHDDLAGIDLNLVVALDALLAEKHVTRAAERLGITQSAASHALARLRDQLGDPVLVRGPTGLVPTALATRLAPQLAKVLDDLSGVLRGEVFDPATSKRTFHVGGSDYSELLVLPRLAAQIAKLAPNIDVWSHTKVDLLGDEPVSTGKLDLTFQPHRPSGARASGMFEKTLAKESFVCVMRKKHPLAKQKLTLARYCDVPHLMIAPNGTPGSFVDDALALQGRVRRVAMAVPHFLIVPYILQSTDLVATVALRIAELFAQHLDLVMTPPPIEVPPFEIAMLWHERNHHDPAQRWFRDQIVAATT